MNDRDPETMAGEDVLERLIREAEEAKPAPTSADVPPAVMTAGSGEPLTEGKGTSPLGGLLGGLLSNPALLSALPQLIKGLGGLSTSSAVAASAPASPAAKVSDTDQKPEAAPTQTLPVSVSRAGSAQHHTALLCALKPYLGSDRRQAVEYMINLCRVWDTLQGMGISLPMLLSATTAPTEEKEV